jgi:5-formyltetrahydrofolate cyclo-ligase
MAKNEKAEARRQAAKLIRALSREERIEKSLAACRHLLLVPEVCEARTIVLYAPLHDELDVWPAVHALAEAGKRIVMPKCVPETRDVLCFEVADFEHDLAPGTFNIPEPVSGRSVSVDQLNLVVSPGRAFDRAGNRLGRGVGYYDRFFVRPGFTAFKCGLAFDCQIFPTVPIVAHDIPVDAIVTESGLLRTRRPRFAQPGQDKHPEQAAAERREDDQGR